MRKEINLLKSKEKSAKSWRYQPLVRTWTTILILGYIVLTIVILAINFFLSRQEAEIQAKIAQKEQGIKEQARVEALHVMVKSRLEALTWIFKGEKGKIGLDEALRRVRELTGERVEIKNIEVGNFGNSVVLSGSVLQVTDLIVFFDQLDSIEAGGIEFEGIYVSGLRKSREGYQFGLTLTYSS